MAVALLADGLKRPYHVQELIDQSAGTETLDDTLAALKAAVTAAGRIYDCPKCRTEGVHALSFDTGNPADTDLILCTMVSAEGVDCSGWGYTTEPVKVDVPTPLRYVNA